MISGIKKGLAGLVLALGMAVSGASVPGCAISYRDGREKVDVSIVVIPGIGAGKFNHTIYKDYGSTDVECAFDSSIVGNILGGGAFEMQVSEENRKSLWRYRIESMGMKDGKLNCKLKVWDSERRSSDWMRIVPNFLPSSVRANASGSSFSNLTGSTYYFNLDERQVDPRYLLSDSARKFVADSIGNK